MSYLIDRIYEINEIDEIALEIKSKVELPSILLFHSPMGTGKTTLIRAICKQFGVNQNVDSPTFSLVNTYQGQTIVHHFDLYRLKDSQELNEIGFVEYLETNGLVLIEWPEIASRFFQDFFLVEMDIIGAQTRRLRLSYHLG